jgi:hypothetical protein
MLGYDGNASCKEGAHAVAVGDVMLFGKRIIVRERQEETR